MGVSPTNHGPVCVRTRTGRQDARATLYGRMFRESLNSDMRTAILIVFLIGLPVGAVDLIATEPPASVTPHWIGYCGPDGTGVCPDAKPPVSFDAARASSQPACCGSADCRSIRSNCTGRLGEQMPGVKVTGIGKNTHASGFLVAVLGPNHYFDRTLQREPEPAPTICISILGLNDSKQGPKGVEPFTTNLREGVRLMRERKLTAILATPSTWGGLTQTKPYAEAARVLAAELKCPLIDLYAVQSELIIAHTKDGKLDPVFSPTWDGVHLSAVGSTLWAGTILKAFGLKPEWKKFQLGAGVSEVGAMYAGRGGETTGRGSARGGQAAPSPRSQQKKRKSNRTCQPNTAN